MPVTQRKPGAWNFIQGKPKFQVQREGAQLTRTMEHLTPEELTYLRILATQYLSLEACEARRRARQLGLGWEVTE